MIRAATPWLTGNSAIQKPFPRGSLRSPFRARDRARPWANHRWALRESAGGPCMVSEQTGIVSWETGSQGSCTGLLGGGGAQLHFLEEVRFKQSPKRMKRNPNRPFWNLTHLGESLCLGLPPGLLVRTCSQHCVPATWEEMVATPKVPLLGCLHPPCWALEDHRLPPRPIQSAHPPASP